MRVVAFASLVVLLSAGVAHAVDDGLVTVTLAVPRDSEAARASVLTAPALRDAFAGDGRFSLPDLEALLDGVDAPPADTALAEALRLKSKADLALSMVDLPVAADAYGQALVAFEQGAGAVVDITELVDAFDKQATTFVLQGDSAGAQSAWARALAIDPGFRVATDAAPRVKKAFDVVLRDYKVPALGKLTVYSTTGAAEVWIDGVPRGASPITVEVPPGRHFVRVAREGYRTWGGAVDVKKNTEATAQAALKPTRMLAKLDELLTRVSRNPDNPENIAELSRLLKVDRMIIAIVGSEGEVASVQGISVDAVNGRVLARAEKSLPIDGDFFTRDATRFFRDRLVSATAERAPATTTDLERTGPSRLSGEAEVVETPGTVVAGWALTAGGVAAVGTGVVLGVLTLGQSAAFRSKQQTDPIVTDIKNAWLFTSIGADVAYVVGAGLLTGGILLLANGYAEQSAREDVLRPGL